MHPEAPKYTHRPFGSVGKQKYRLSGSLIREGSMPVVLHIVALFGMQKEPLIAFATLGAPATWHVSLSVGRQLLHCEERHTPRMLPATVRKLPICGGGAGGSAACPTCIDFRRDFRSTILFNYVKITLCGYILPKQSTPR